MLFGATAFFDLVIGLLFPCVVLLESTTDTAENMQVFILTFEMQFKAMIGLHQFVFLYLAQEVSFTQVFTEVSLIRNLAKLSLTDLVERDPELGLRFVMLGRCSAIVCQH